VNKVKLYTILIFLTIYHFVHGQNKLFIPDTLSGSVINLHLQKGHHAFFNNYQTATLGANGNILGPTLILRKGDDVKINVNNQIGETTTLHWHGLHVAPENDGGPHTPIVNESTWSPTFEIKNRASTCWYHPHLHHKTNEHVTKGISGVIIIRDEIEKKLALPRIYGADDFPLVIQTKDFDSSFEIITQSNHDDILMVNATIEPFLEVPSQVVRCRIVNGASQRAFNLGLNNDQDFYQIATDGGLLPKPFKTKRLLIAPGERVEILIDFKDMTGQTVHLLSYASELPSGIYGATNAGMVAMMTLDGYNPNPLNGKNFKILSFNIIHQTQNPIVNIPNSLVENESINENLANITRTLTFSPMAMGMNQLNGDFVINNASFDMDVINYEIPLNNIEIWELRNQSAISHPFHIHDIQFNILSRNGQTPPPNEQGLKDVVLVRPGETVRFITKFETFSNPHVPYMFHCHLLPHEDGGMMGQFIVTDRLSGTNDDKLNKTQKLKIWPNPATNMIEISHEKEIEVNDQVMIYDTQGKIVYKKLHTLSPKQNIKVDIFQWPSGSYLVKIGSSTFSEAASFIKK
jgi:blue copper oxidase